MNIFLSKKSKILIIIILLCTAIFATTGSIFNWYFTSLTPNINKVVTFKLEKIVYQILTSELNTKVVDQTDLLILNKNNDGEIITVDYDLDKAYIINNNINTSIRNSINNLSSGDLENSEFIMVNGNMYIEEPLLINSKFTIISALGPQIPIKINFVDTVVTNLKTKITSYGLNNALTELYVTTSVKVNIITPVTNEEIKIDYDILIDAAMINGRVPTFYGSSITSESNILDIPLE